MRVPHIFFYLQIKYLFLIFAKPIISIIVIIIIISFFCLHFVYTWHTNPATFLTANDILKPLRLTATPTALKRFNAHTHAIRLTTVCELLPNGRKCIRIDALTNCPAKCVQLPLKSPGCAYVNIFIIFILLFHTIFHLLPFSSDWPLHGCRLIW